MQVKIVNKSNNELPAYSTVMSAGMDLRANLTEPVVLKPLERKLVPTGLFIELPQGFEAQIRPRSGLAIKNGVGVLNSPGTIDSGYRGEVKIILINLGDDQFEVKIGDRIAQIGIREVPSVSFVIKEELSDTKRGEGGFGSTGV